MTETTDALKALVPYVIGITGLVATFVRAEFRGRQNAQDIAEERADRKEQAKEAEARSERQRHDDNKTVQRDFARIFELMQSIQSDVRALVQRGQEKG